MAPHNFVAQSEPETFLGASTGKFTIGLGQTNMSFCDNREDVYSLALTTVSSLMKKYSISPDSIGRLEVGTESMLDKAKSCKTVPMQFFSSNPDIEGADTYNACYGGTNALFNAVHWIESLSWAGKPSSLHLMSHCVTRPLHTRQVVPAESDRADDVRQHVYRGSELTGQRIGVFSFGTSINLHARLAVRLRVSHDFYDESVPAEGYVPVGNVEALAPGTYYLIQVDEKFRRVYALKE
ncbi:hydroxymethylglutaryl-CoA synthase [Penicillium argentinense]|uniref:Hydroxymethylglutaryl-CoA synthase n=1 Tax=Penicillium argentinense TaxID=1131581 RepID=A0A9W9KCE2_9EURO|nr:hydroxymethylglutaryl-CoA synthase [Penicillium argentinense]KAJ5099902.1 hydroxymethylglutaryl-CoA synthase [Penicillium argentinense]